MYLWAHNSIDCELKGKEICHTHLTLDDGHVSSLAGFCQRMRQELVPQRLTLWLLLYKYFNFFFVGYKILCFVYSGGIVLAEDITQTVSLLVHTIYVIGCSVWRSISQNQPVQVTWSQGEVSCSRK